MAAKGGERGQAVDGSDTGFAPLGMLLRQERRYRRSCWAPSLRYIPDSVMSVEWLIVVDSPLNSIAANCGMAFDSVQVDGMMYPPFAEEVAIVYGSGAGYLLVRTVHLTVAQE